MRYAIYLAPNPESRLWSFGSRVVGYDAARRVDVEQPAIPGLTRAVTQDPRRYGFHGTLKAPFALAPAHEFDELIAACRAFAAGCAALPPIDLVVKEIGSFIALVPAEPSPALNERAADIVRRFDPFRAPLSAADRARRNPERLTARQVENLDAFGYPYIFEDFRFHMTLTGAVADESERTALRAALSSAWEAGDAGPLIPDALTLFAQKSREDRFILLERFPFAG